MGVLRTIPDLVIHEKGPKSSAYSGNREEDLHKEGRQAKSAGKKGHQHKVQNEVGTISRMSPKEATGTHRIPPALQ